MKKWYTYVDWTTEVSPVAFYVGKGDESRVQNLKRANIKHSNISKKYGQDRKIILVTEDEDEALREEIRLIKEHKTYVYDPESGPRACNYTIGGEGASGINRVPILVTWPDGLTKTYPSTVEAADALQVAPSLIGRAIDGKRDNTIKGCKFERLEIRPRKKKNSANHANNFNTVPIEETMIDGTVVVHDSINALCSELQAHRAVINCLLEGSARSVELAAQLGRPGHTFKKLIDRKHKPLTEDHKLAIKLKNKGKVRNQETCEKIRVARSRPVVQFDAARVMIHQYASLKEACRCLCIGKNVAYRLMKEGILAWENS